MTRHDAYGSVNDDAGDADAPADVPARRGARTGLRPPLPDLHDPAPPRCDHHGRSTICQPRCGPGALRLPLRVRRKRGPDDGNRSDAPDAWRRHAQITPDSNPINNETQIVVRVPFARRTRL